MILMHTHLQLSAVKILAFSKHTNVSTLTKDNMLAQTYTSLQYVHTKISHSTACEICIVNVVGNCAHL